MSTEKNNESAFPVISNRQGEYNITEFGLTKREYFAAMAMQGYCANEAIARNGITLTEKAQSAVMMADELLNQLKQ